MFSPRSLFLLATFGLASASAPSDCTASVHNNTIAYFSSAPMTFSLDLGWTASDCERWCAEIPKCQAWLFVNQSGQCDVYRNAPLSISDSAGFIYGGCDPVAAASVEKIQVAPPLLHLNMASTTTVAASSSAVAKETPSTTGSLTQRKHKAGHLRNHRHH